MQPSEPILLDLSAFGSIFNRIMHTYSSQEHVIAYKARERGISSDVIRSYFDQKIEEVSVEFPDHALGWRLGRAEFLLWERFCELMI
jgi:hypothetical protein